MESVPYPACGCMCRLLWGKLRLGQLLAAFQEVALMSAGDFADGLSGRLCHLAQTGQPPTAGQLQQALDVSVQVCPAQHGAPPLLGYVSPSL